MLIGGIENSFREKLTELQDNEVLNLIQIIFQYNKKNMLMEKRIVEVISEVFGE